MKRKWIILLVFVASLCAFSFSHFGVVYADMNDAQSVGEATGGQYGTPSKKITTYTIDEDKDLYIFTSYIDSDSVFDKWENAGLVQAPFWIAKEEYQFAQVTTSFFSGIHVAKDYSARIINSSKAIWDGLFGGQGLYLIALGVLISLIMAMVKGDFWKRFGHIVLTFFLLSLFFNAGSTIIDKAFTASDNLSQFILGNVKIDGVSSKSINMRNVMLLHPFLLMNYDFGMVPNLDKKGDVKEVEALLNSGGDVSVIQRLEGTGDGANQHLTIKTLGDKFSVALASVINNFVLMVVIVGFRLGAFVMQMLFLIFMLLLAYVAVASFIPNLSDSLTNLFKKLFMFFALSFVFTLGVILALYLNNFLDGLFSKNMNYLFATILKMIIVAVLWKFRREIISVFHASGSALGNTGLLRGLQNVKLRMSRGLSLQGGRLGYGMTGGLAGGAAVMAWDKVQQGARNSRLKRQLNRYSRVLEDSENGDLSSEEQADAKGQVQQYDQKFEKMEKKANGKSGGRRIQDSKQETRHQDYRDQLDKVKEVREKHKTAHPVDPYALSYMPAHIEEASSTQNRAGISQARVGDKTTSISYDVKKKDPGLRVGDKTTPISYQVKEKNNPRRKRRL